MNPAAAARRAKEAHPERYCQESRCLWRIWMPWGPKEPCPKHMMGGLRDATGVTDPSSHNGEK